MTRDGKPYGPIKYKQLNKEIYYIVKGAGYSYEAVLEMTPVQRQYIREFIKEEIELNKKSIEQVTSKQTNRMR